MSKDEVPSLLTDLQSIDMKIREISSEIEHAKRQEAFLNKANGKFFIPMTKFNVKYKSVL